IIASRRSRSCRSRSATRACRRRCSRSCSGRRSEKNGQSHQRSRRTMSRVLTVELSDTAYAVLSQKAQVAGTSPTQLAAAALEKQFGAQPATAKSSLAVTEDERQAARMRFERHFGAVDLGRAIGADNEEIDADLAREYAD